LLDFQCPRVETPNFNDSSAKTKHPLLAETVGWGTQIFNTALGCATRRNESARAVPSLFCQAGEKVLQGNFLVLEDVSSFHTPPRFTQNVVSQ
jgi:hypothetical protein